MLETRIQNRRNDVSDATPEVLHQQLGWDIGAIDWARLSVEGDVASCVAAASAPTSPTADGDSRAR